MLLALLWLGTVALAAANRALLEAAVIGDAEAIVKLVRHAGADVNHRITLDDYDLVQDAPFGILKDGDNPTALSCAVAFGHRLAVKALLELSASIDEEITCGETDNVDQDKIYNCHWGYTPLMIAACQGFDGIAADLIEAGAPLARPPSLTCAVYNAHAATVNVLLKGGAPIPTGILHNITSRVKVAHDQSLEDGLLESLDHLLMAGANVDEEDPDGDTPLILAAFAARPTMVSALLAAGAAPDAVDGAALKSAALHGYVEVVQLLLDGGAAPDGLNTAKDGSPLFRAASEGHLEVARVLLQHGARVDAPGLKTWLGRTPLMVAAGTPNYQLVMMLIDATVDTGAWRLNAVDAGGDTALHLFAHPEGIIAHTAATEAYALTKEELSTLRRVRFRCATALLDAGANPNTQGFEKQTPLMSAAMYKYRGDDPELEYKELVSALFRHGADVELQSSYGRTALFYAVRGGNLFMIQALIDAGVNVNAAADVAGERHTALMYVALLMVLAKSTLQRKRHQHVMIMLLSSGADRPPRYFMHDLQQRAQEQKGLGQETIDLLEVYHSPIDERLTKMFKWRTRYSTNVRILIDLASMSLIVCFAVMPLLMMLELVRPQHRHTPDAPGVRKREAGRKDKSRPTASDSRSTSSLKGQTNELIRRKGRSAPQRSEACRPEDTIKTAPLSSSNKPHKQPLGLAIANDSSLARGKSTVWYVLLLVVMIAALVTVIVPSLAASFGMFVSIWAIVFFSSFLFAMVGFAWGHDMLEQNVTVRSNLLVAAEGDAPPDANAAGPPQPPEAGEEATRGQAHSEAGGCIAQQVRGRGRSSGRGTRRGRGTGRLLATGMAESVDSLGPPTVSEAPPADSEAPRAASGAPPSTAKERANASEHEPEGESMIPPPAALSMDADESRCSSDEVVQPALAAPETECECCVVCMHQPRTHIFGPCGHHCVCSACGEAVMQSSERKCPICRESAHVFMKVFTIGSA